MTDQTVLKNLIVRRTRLTVMTEAAVTEAEDALSKARRAYQAACVNLDVILNQITS